MPGSGASRSGPPGGETERRPGWGVGHGAGLLWLLVAALVVAIVWGPLAPAPSDQATISYTTFLHQVDAGNVGEVRVKGSTIRGKLSKPATASVNGQAKSYTSFVTYVPSFGDPDLLKTLRARNVTVHTEPESSFSWWPLLFEFGPLLLLLWLGWTFVSRMRQPGEGVFAMGRSRARPYDRTKESTTFADVAGLEGVKQEVEEIIEFLKDPSRFSRLGGVLPRGVLLVGPPGTGKTLLARAVAGEAGVPFFHMTGSDFMEMFVGVGAARVRDLFEEAKKAAPSIIFIDELDSIGRLRGAGLGGGHDEREQTLNQLLSEMDGFASNHQVIVLAATNRPDILDPALLRPGRFDRRIAVDLPGKAARREILDLYAREKPLADDVDLDALARGTPGFSGADLENLLNEAALLAARQNKDRIDSGDINAAWDKVVMGLERQNLALTEEERRILAYHEGGHSVLAAVLPHADPLHKVTIVPRGRALGVTQQLPERDKYLYLREYVLDRLTVMLGGRAAEELVLHTASSGAEQDLKEATDLARKMVLDWGMSERFKDIAFGGPRQQVFLGQEIGERREFSDATARELDGEVRKVLDEAYDRAVSTLRRHRDGLERLADELVDKEEVGGDRVLEILGVARSSETAERDEAGARAVAGGNGADPAGKTGIQQPAPESGAAEPVGPPAAVPSGRSS